MIKAKYWACIFQYVTKEVIFCLCWLPKLLPCKHKSSISFQCQKQFLPPSKSPWTGVWWARYEVWCQPLVTITSPDLITHSWRKPNSHYIIKPSIRLETDSGMTAFTGQTTVITSIAARLNVSVTSEDLGTPSHSIWRQTQNPGPGRTTQLASTQVTKG